MSFTAAQMNALMAEGISADAINRAAARLAPTKPAPAPAPATGRRIGPRAIALLHHFESCRLTAYLCPARVWTIGWGNTRYANGQPVREGDRITQATADELFKTILRQFEDGVNAAAPNATAAEFGAMVALAYNIGLAGFRRSSVLRLHLAGDKARAANAFLLWNKAGGKVLNGLVRRREAERLLYLNDLPAFDRAIGYKP